MENDNVNLQHIAAALCSTIAKKNADYGNAFAHMWTEEGDIVGAIHIKEKANRIVSLCKSQNQVDESLDDALRDCAGYCLLMLDLRQRRAE